MEEGERIKLRLDIPAYTNHGVWVPTIHNLSGKPISHESTAIVTNVDLMMSGRIGLKALALLGQRLRPEVKRRPP